MSEYLGYRVIVNGITIPETMMIRESFATTPGERVIYTWVDANQITHEEVSETPKMYVEFTIRRRTLEEHEEILDAFEAFQNVYVTYWDDRSCSYKQGLFKMDPPQFVTYVERDELWYAPTAIRLTEY